MSGNEFWPLLLDDLIEPPLDPDDPFDFLRREYLGTGGESCNGESCPWFKFRRRLVCRVVLDGDGDGVGESDESIKL